MYIKEQCYNSYLEMLKKKIRSLVFPYLLWNCMFAVMAVAPNIVNGAGVDVKRTFWGIIRSEYDPPLFFIRIIFIYGMLFPLIKFVITKKVVFFIVILLSIGINIIIGPTIGYGSFRYWLPVYLMGAWFGSRKPDFIVSRNLKKKTACVLLLILFLMALLASKNDYLLYAYRMISPLIVWKLADVFYIGTNPSNAYKISFFIFCAHAKLLGIVSKAYLRIAGNSTVSIILSLLVLPAAIVTVIELVAWFLRRYVPAIWRLCNAGRK